MIRAEVGDATRARRLVRPLDASTNAIADFSATVEWAGTSRCTVVLTGEVDMYTSPTFERMSVSAIEAGAREVTVDLTEASFIDSTFLGALTVAHKKLDELGGRISILCADPNLTKVFEITGLDNVFPIRPARAGGSRKEHGGMSTGSATAQLPRTSPVSR